MKKTYLWLALALALSYGLALPTTTAYAEDGIDSSETGDKGQTGDDNQGTLGGGNNRDDDGAGELTQTQPGDQTSSNPDSGNNSEVKEPTGDSGTSNTGNTKPATGNTNTSASQNQTPTTKRQPQANSAANQTATNEAQPEENQTTAPAKTEKTDQKVSDDAQTESTPDSGAAEQSDNHAVEGWKVFVICLAVAITLSIAGGATYGVHRSKKQKSAPAAPEILIDETVAEEDDIDFPAIDLEEEEKKIKTTKEAAKEEKAKKASKPKKAKKNKKTTEQASSEPEISVSEPETPDATSTSVE